MRRTLILSLALMVACARPEQPDPNAALDRDVTLSDFVGTWEGAVRPQGSDTVVAHVELLATPTETGWSFTVASAANPAEATTTPARVTALGGDSVVVEAGPFPSVLRPGETVSTHSVYRLRVGRLVGVVHATYGDGGTVVLETEASRRP